MAVGGRPLSIFHHSEPFDLRLWFTMMAVMVDNGEMVIKLTIYHIINHHQQLIFANNDGKGQIWPFIAAELSSKLQRSPRSVMADASDPTGDGSGSIILGIEVRGFVAPGFIKVSEIFWLLGLGRWKNRPFHVLWVEQLLLGIDPGHKWHRGIVIAHFAPYTGGRCVIFALRQSGRSS